MDRPLTREDLGFQALEDEPLDVLDLPQIHTKPSAKALLDTLSLLSVESRSWEVSPSHTPGRGTPRAVSGASTPVRPPNRKVKPEGVPRYLTKIVSSHLGWISSDEDKEKIWDTASIRLSERSGRSARGAFTRAFPVPLLHFNTLHSAEAGETHVSNMLDLQIHEPALTADNLGFKTWASSYVLACRWERLLERVPALNKCCGKDASLLLELGAGTGLVGIAAAAVLGARVLMTDLPLIVDNLALNVKSNMKSIQGRSGTAEVAVLDWSKPEEISPMSIDVAAPSSAQCPIMRGDSDTKQSLEALVIVAADPIYSMEHPPLLAKAVGFHLSKATDAVVITAVPLRSLYSAERAELRAQFQQIGLRLLFEEADIGSDDWGEGGGDEPSEVECSTTVWTWA